MEAIETKRPDPARLPDRRLEGGARYAPIPRPSTTCRGGQIPPIKRIDFVRKAIESRPAQPENVRAGGSSSGRRNGSSEARGPGLGHENRDAGMGYNREPGLLKAGIRERGGRRDGRVRVPPARPPPDLATCDPDKSASARVLEKIGMIREGRLRRTSGGKGDWRTRSCTSILYPSGAGARGDSLSRFIASRLQSSGAALEA